MRLLNVYTKDFRDFLSDLDIKPYAILSHTWAEDEVLFEHFQSLPKKALQKKKGYAKIEYCCLQAIADGYDWVWIDTCCIDKRSSAELSEAINSMFRWYKDSAICYAYFSDVQAHAGSDFKVLHAQLFSARWFTRGWTLQELLAPRDIVLYSSGWNQIGTRSGLCEPLSEITGVEIKYLCGHAPLETASVSKRMSWAARRNTSRTEDLAYCLFGIFDVNMPLLYGEGKKAFRRLQEEIMKTNPTDHTLFAWGRIVDRPMGQITSNRLFKPMWPESMPWEASQAEATFHGLFAESPKSFEGSSQYKPWPGTYRFYNLPTQHRRVPYPTVAGARVTLQLPLLPAELFAFHWPRLKVTQTRSLDFAILLCQSENGFFVIIPLYQWGHDQSSRTDELMYTDKIFSHNELFSMARHVQIEPRRHPGPQLGDALVCCWGNTRLHERSWRGYHVGVHRAMAEGIISIPQGGAFGRLWTIYFQLIAANRKSPFGFGIVFDREITHPSLSVSCIPVLVDEPKTEESLERDGFTWPHFSTLGRGQWDVLFKKAMAVPDDTWRLDTAPFPVVEVRVRKMQSGSEPEDHFFLVDLTIFPPDY